MSSWGEGFAEGDSGTPTLGTATRLWREIEDAAKEVASAPKRLRAKSLAHVQADVLKLAEDESNDVGARVAAYRLAWEMAQHMADADVDPLANGA